MSTNPFVGVWRLVSSEARTAAGAVSYPHGKDASGYLIYTAEGYMSVAIMQANRANFASPSLQAGSVEEKKASFDTYLSYGGTYRVNGDAVIHNVKMSLFPNWTGTDQIRDFQFSGNRLILRTPPVVMRGGEQTVELIWERAA